MRNWIVFFNIICLVLDCLRIPDAQLDCLVLLLLPGLLLLLSCLLLLCLLSLLGFLLCLLVLGILLCLLLVRVIKLLMGLPV